MPEGSLRTEVVNDVLTIVIDRPEVKNALTLRMRNDLCDLLAEADSDTTVRAVVLTATDPVFSAGVERQTRAG